MSTECCARIYTVIVIMVSDTLNYIVQLFRSTSLAHRTDQLIVKYSNLRSNQSWKVKTKL